MKELKVGVNPRYLMQSRENHSRCPTVNAVGPNGNLNDFEDLNLHKLTTEQQQAKDRAATMHSSMGKVSPSIVTNHEERDS